ncbi:flagellar hook-basal body complex protein FliE, partial [Vibrio parahaemolyticus]|nr:flagellar hook-basal body complex protein FliE [Vibrio parahaemolyticus]
MSYGTLIAVSIISFVNSQSFGLEVLMKIDGIQAEMRAMMVEATNTAPT